MVKRAMIKRDEIKQTELPHNSAPGNNYLENIVRSATVQAAGIMSRKRPRFNTETILKYIDTGALEKYANEIGPYLSKGELSPEEAYDYLASHIVSGDFLTENGKEMILNKSLEDEARKWGGFSKKGRQAKRVLKGEEYLDEAMSAFREIYDLMQSNKEYSNHMPELSKAVNALYELGFRDVTLNAMRKNLSPEKYLAAKEGIIKAARYAGDYAQKTVESYVSHSLAAVILSIVGISVLVSSYNLSGNSISGNMIGSSASISIPAIFFGVASLIFGVYLFLKGKKKKTITTHHKM